MLWRKLWRDIKGNLAAYLAVTSVIIIGLMLYVSLSILLDNLTQAQKNYYLKNNFADGFAQIVSGPPDLVKDLEKLKGIRQASGRIVKDILVYKPSGEDITTLRLISFDEKAQKINKFRLEEGRIPREGQKEILVSPSFLQGNNYKIGVQIPLILEGREIKFTITGTAISPEYIYEIPNGQTITPNPKNFGVGYLSYATMAPLFGMDGKINDLVFTLENGVKFTSIKRLVSKQLEPYGLNQNISSDDQVSNSIFTLKLKQLKGSATSTPIIFLLVAASILYIMLRRMVEQQRGQIGILKAFGFNEREIISHYIGYAVFIGFAGGLGGGLAGSALSFVLAKLYQQYFNIPQLSGSFSASYIFTGTLLSTLFSAVAGFQGAKRLLYLFPSEAMRAAAPAVVKKTIIERFNLLWRALSTLAKMAIRNLFRSKQRSILAILGIASAFSMMVASGASFDAIDYLVSFQFDKVEKYDIKVILQQFANTQEAVNAGMHISGVKKAEPLLEIPATLSHNWLQKDIAIVGVPHSSTLYSLLNNSEHAVALPETGLVVSTQLAKTLNIHPGDAVTIKPFTGDRKERQVMVTELIPQYVGLGAYMQLSALSNLLQAPPVASSVLLRVDSNKLPQVRKELQKGKNVLSINDKTKLKSDFEELMKSSKSTLYIFLFFAFLTGFAIIYNVTLISLAERERELATLLVLGMTEGEVGRILIYEQSLLGLCGILLGIPLSFAMLYAMGNAASSELYNMPIIISPQSILIGIIGTLLVLLAAQWKVKGKIGKISMLDVLKEQE